jgi:predicted nucleic acid-binding protein
MRYYADTGLLLSLHVQETTSAAAVALVQTLSEPLPVTPLIALEFRNALRLGVFRQTITEAERAAAWSSFQQDLAAGTLERTEVDAPRAQVEAESLCDQFTAITGVRTLDLLHVAYARLLARTEFLTFDKRQRSLAMVAGLKVWP